MLSFSGPFLIWTTFASSTGFGSRIFAVLVGFPAVVTARIFSAALQLPPMAVGTLYKCQYINTRYQDPRTSEHEARCIADLDVISSRRLCSVLHGIKSSLFFSSA